MWVKVTFGSPSTGSAPPAVAEGVVGGWVVAAEVGGAVVAAAGVLVLGGGAVVGPAESMGVVGGDVVSWTVVEGEASAVVSEPSSSSPQEVRTSTVAITASPSGRRIFEQ